MPFLAILVILAGACTLGNGENTTYVVALLGQDIQINGTSYPDTKYELVMSNPGTSDVTVNVIGVYINKTETIPQNEKVSVEIEYDKGLNGSEYSNKSIIVHSSDGFFTLQVFSYRADHEYVEGLLAIPVENLTGPNQPDNQSVPVYNYVVSTFCDIGGFCQIAIAAGADNTSVSIRLPIGVDPIVLCKDKAFYRTNEDPQITLNKFDSLQLESTYDLTGTVIYSFEPIAVFAGSRNVTNGEVVAHTMEQLVPSSHWGTEYIVQNLGTNGYGDILKLVSHWSDTKVTMTGYDSFIMPKHHTVVVRRLDKGATSHIRATHPIQVMQISGLSYATENETSTLSMTFVPSIQNTLPTNTKVACHSTNVDGAKFYFVKEKLSTSTLSVNSISPSETIKIKYSKYEATSLVSTGDNFKVTTTEGSHYNGMLTCGTATMPLSVLYNPDVATTDDMVPTYTGGTCYEGFKASSVFDKVSKTITPHTLDLTTYPDHVVEMRIRACSQAVLQFKGPTDFNNSLFMTVSPKEIINKQCMPICKNATTSIVMDGGFHTAADENWDCDADMMYAWFLQKQDGNSYVFCYGLGKYNVTKCDGTDTSAYIQIQSRFTEVKLSGLTSDAEFNWDYVNTAGCDLFESNWRCADRWTNCSSYGTEFCSIDQYSDFSNVACAKHCGKCFADSYGRKFIVRLPTYMSWLYESCNIIVSPLNKKTNIAVTGITIDTSEEKVVRSSGRHANGERYYDCKATSLVFTVLTDDDAAVVVLFRILDIDRSYRVYPVDTYGTEFMMLEYDKSLGKDCTFATEHENVMVTPRYSIHMDQNALKDSEKKQLEEGSRLQSVNGNEMSGAVIMFDKPSTVFCGEEFSTISASKYFHQLLPVKTWSTDYVIPAFEGQAINRPFDAKVVIVATEDNTVINITGGFDAVKASYDRGDLVQQEIDPSAAYRVTATKPVGVGLFVYDSSDNTKSSFNLLPPSLNFHDTVVTSVPTELLVTPATEIQTFYVDSNLVTSNVTMTTDNVGAFYRHVRRSGAVYEMTVIKSGNTNWLIVPGNIKATTQQTNAAHPVCSVEANVIADTKDNDCDGLVDEDVCFKNYGVYREDTDLDGGFGEDCSEVFTEPVVEPKPANPVCVEIDKPEGQCWMACKCLCSWVEKLNAQKNMTKDELVAAQQDDINQIQTALTVNTENLKTTTAQKVSAKDDRKSAAGIGYLGIALFALVFGTIFIMDITSLLRDARILISNLKEGFDRLRNLC